MSEVSSFRDKCGVFGVVNHQNATSLTALGLHALQHRGQESCGIAVIDSHSICHSEKHEGYVANAFFKNQSSMLTGKLGIGHVRYSTSGSKKEDSKSCIQPFCGQTEFGHIAIAHNGNLVEYQEVKKKLLQEKTFFTTDVDTEVILHLILRSNKKTIEERIFDAVSQVKGAFSLVILTENFICAIRDTNGIRPLCIGTFEGAGIVSSESCGISAIGGEVTRDVSAGEVLFLYKNGQQKSLTLPNVEERFCIFEYIYFSRPDTTIANKSVYSIRRNIGAVLFEEESTNYINPEEYVVVPVPDSGIPSAMGYASAAGLQFEFGIIRNHYVGRTFIDPSSGKRADKVKMKHAPNIQAIKGKKVILVDDSIVRGNTSKKIVKMLKQAGAREIHMKIASPPTKFPCFYGSDTPTKQELIANNMAPSQIAEFLDVESLQYISIAGLKKACGNSETYCLACFDGNYFV